MEVSGTIETVAKGKPRTSRHGYGEDALVWLAAVERLELACALEGFNLQRFCTKVALCSAGPIQCKGSPGTYRSKELVPTQVGPVLAQNQLGQVYVELFEDFVEYVEIVHKQGSFVWLNPERISWNAGMGS